MSNFGSTGSISSYAYNRVQSIPTSVSGTPMVQFAEIAVYELENWTGASIGTTSIDSKYSSYLINRTVAMTLANMHGVGVHFNWQLGAFNVSKGNATNTEAMQVDAALKACEQELQSLGRPQRVYATYYG